MIDKVALQKTFEEIEALAELDPREKEKIEELRTDITTVIITYLDKLGARSKTDTLEQLSNARDALYEIFRAAGTAQQTVALVHNSAQKELADCFIHYLTLIRAQAQRHFNSTN